METPTADTVQTATARRSPRTVARIAGAFYVLLIGFGIFSELIVRSDVVVRGDPATTASNVLASETLFRVSILSDVAAQVAFLMVAVVLYGLLEPVDARYAGVMVLFVAVSVPITILNLVNQVAALHLLTGAEYLTSFDQSQVEQLALFFLDLHSYGYSLNEVFFGLWLVPLGYLVYRSAYFPRILGILLILGAVGHLVSLVHVFVLPGYEVITYPGLAVAAIAEFGFVLYLLIRGVSPSAEATPTQSELGQ